MSKNLRYVSIQLDRDVVGIEENSIFTYKCRFIDNYLSRDIRKYHLPTNGEYDMLSICLDRTGTPHYAGFSSLKVYVPLSPGIDYHNLTTEDIVEIYRKTAIEYDGYLDFPGKGLLASLDHFVEAGYKNQWVVKQQRFKELGLTVRLHADFNTRYFELYADVYETTKNILCTGLVARTRPDEVHYDGWFREIHYDDGYFFICDFTSMPIIAIDVEQAKSGNLVSHFPDYRNHPDPWKRDYYSKINEKLFYTAPSD